MKGDLGFGREDAWEGESAVVRHSLQSWRGMGQGWQHRERVGSLGGEPWGGGWREELDWGMASPLGGKKQIKTDMQTPGLRDCFPRGYPPLPAKEAAA